MKLIKEIATLACGLALAFGVLGGAQAGSTTIVSGNYTGAANGSAGGYGGATSTVVTYYSGTGGSYSSGSPLAFGNFAASTYVIPTNDYGANSPATYALNCKPNSSLPTWSSPLSGSNWISPYVYTGNQLPSHSAGQPLNAGQPLGYYAFTTTYTLAPGQTTWSFVGKSLSQSGVVEVLLDGSPATLSPAGSLTGPTAPFTTPQTFSGSGTGSTVTLTYIVQSVATENNDIGLDYSGTFVPEPATIVAFLIAMLGIAGLVLKNRKGQYSTTLA